MIANQAQAPKISGSGGLPLVFERPLVIVGGGDADPEFLRACAGWGWGMIAADGGAENCALAGIWPEAIVGDLDSLQGMQFWSDRTRIIRLTEQNTTDFEKCLYATSAPLWVAAGMTGGRFDHTLAALDAVARHARRAPILLVDRIDVAAALSGPFQFEVDKGERVSVHPLTEIGFLASEGLAYGLAGLTLKQGTRTGTSNQAPNGAFSIEPQGRDPWLLIVDNRHVAALVANLWEHG